VSQELTATSVLALFETALPELLSFQFSPVKLERKAKRSQWDMGEAGLWHQVLLRSHSMPGAPGAG